MKLLISIVLLLSTVTANAGFLEDLLKDAVKKELGHNQRPPRYPGNPYEPGRPGYGGGVTCVAEDRGYEEHGGGHYSCGECLREHGECIETCSARAVECQAEGIDRGGRRVGFVGRGESTWRAEDEAMRACYYNAYDCRVTRCQERNETISRRSCR